MMTKNQIKAHQNNCPHDTDTIYLPIEHSNGRWAIKEVCGRCGKYFRFVPLTDELRAKFFIPSFA